MSRPATRTLLSSLLRRRALPTLIASPRSAAAFSTAPTLFKQAAYTTPVVQDPMTGEFSQLPDIDASKLVVDSHPNPGKPPPSSKLVFGRTFTDHMLAIPWNSQKGWGTPTIKPYGPIALDPSATVLHYAFTLFEGMKAYRCEDGTIRLFRPNKNMERMNTSASRIALPNFDGEALTTLIKRLVMVDSNWVPGEPGHSLYIRPTLIGTQNALGVGPSTDALLFVICSPVGPYYPTGFKPVSLLATTAYTRAGPGGTGGFKLGANYAPAVVPQVEAAKMGYSQNLWLLGDDHLLTEVGTMNMFIVLKKDDGKLEVVTPPLTDIILPGVTRDSIINLLRSHSSPTSPSDTLPGLPSADEITITERQIPMSEVEAASKSGNLVEMFGSGTAALVSPVDRIGYEGRDIHVPTGPEGLGKVAKAVLDRIVGIQMGKIESPWSVIASEEGKDPKEKRSSMF